MISSRRLPGTLWAALLCACAGSGRPDQGEQKPAGGSPAPGETSQPLRVGVGVAASLRPVVDELARDYEARNPGVTIHVESGGSNALCRQAVELHAPLDLLVLADAALFAELLQPAWTDHHVLLASDRLVLARSAHAPGADRVGPENLVDVLLSEGVRIGMADPDRAPLGYRTILALQLLERREGRAGLAAELRNKVGERFVWPDASALLAHLQSGEIDYSFLYAASAVEAELAFTELPPETNLGSLDHAEAYAAASVSVVGLTPGSTLTRRGEPIVYGAALAKSSENDHATRFMAELVGARGAKSLEAHGFGTLVGHPRRVVGNLPQKLATLMTLSK